MAQVNAAFFALVGAVLLSGCAHNPLRPSVPDWSENPGYQEGTESIDKSKNFLRAQQQRIVKAASGSNAQDWSQKEVALAGGVMAVAGQLASKTALLNSGLGIGAIALAVNGFYQPRESMKRHLDALKEFNCLARTASPLSNNRLLAAKLIDDKEKREEVLTAPAVLSEMIDDALIRYARTVLELTPGSSSPSDIQRFYQALAKDVANQNKARLDAEEARRHAEETKQEARVAGGSAAQVKADEARAAEERALAEEAAVPFIGLKTRLEACNKMT